jgi:hypothetical protein
VPRSPPRARRGWGLRRPRPAPTDRSLLRRACEGKYHMDGMRHPEDRGYAGCACGNVLHHGACGGIGRATHRATRRDARPCAGRTRERRVSPRP